MNFLKNKTSWIMLFILFLGLILRMAFIDKAEGLWNDEYTSWMIASIPLGKHFVDAVFSQCHMPFYYLYLKFFIRFFGNSDLMLRLTSVLTGFLSIIVMYFVGKEFRNKNLGLLCAAFTSISSFLIYFSQEVRPYGILFLFASLSLLFMLRLGRKQNLYNFIGFLIFQILIIFTHTIGFVFVFFNLIFMSAWVSKIDNKYKKPVIIGWTSIVAFVLLMTPLIYGIFTAHTFNQWWGSFTVSRLAFLFTDYFSPILTNIVNAPDNFFYNFTLEFVIFAIIPALIAIVGIIKSLTTESYKATGMFLVFLASIFVMVFMSILGKLVFITKYSIEIYPILIVLSCFGLQNIENKKLSKFLIFLFCFLNVFYIFTNPNSAPKMHRAEGHKIVANLLKNADLKNRDYILLNYYSQEKYEKYFNFKDYNVFSINKGNFVDYLSKGMTFDLALKGGKYLYKPVFENPENKYFDSKLDSEIIDKLKPNQKLTIIILNTVAMYSPVQMQSLVQNPQEYKKTPLLFLVFSYVKNETLKECMKKMHISRLEQKGSWSAVTFVK